VANIVKVFQQREKLGVFCKIFCRVCSASTTITLVSLILIINLSFHLGLRCCRGAFGRRKACKPHGLTITSGLSTIGTLLEQLTAVDTRTQPANSSLSTIRPLLSRVANKRDGERCCRRKGRSCPHVVQGRSTGDVAGPSALAGSTAASASFRGTVKHNNPELIWKITG
jgi:hypothetical protein